MKLSDKFNSIYDLIEVDNKDAIVREVKALKNFTDIELASIFGSSSILWILETYSVRELKDAVRKIEKGIDIHVGDFFTYKHDDMKDIVGVILEVCGISKDRCIALCYSNMSKTFRIQEGISSFDIDILDSTQRSNIESMIGILTADRSANEISVAKGGDI